LDTFAWDKKKDSIADLGLGTKMLDGRNHCSKLLEEYWKEKGSASCVFDQPEVFLLLDSTLIAMYENHALIYSHRWIRVTDKKKQPLGIKDLSLLTPDSYDHFQPSPWDRLVELFVHRKASSSSGPELSKGRCLMMGIIDLNPLTPGFYKYYCQVLGIIWWNLFVHRKALSS